MMDSCDNFNFMQLNATICNYVRTILKLMQLYATILQQFRMQLYETMQHATYATSTTLWNLCNFMQLYATYATMQLYSTYVALQLYATI